MIRISNIRDINMICNNICTLFEVKLCIFVFIKGIKFSPPLLTLILIVFADATVLNAEAFSSTAYKPELVSGIIERRRAYTRKYRIGL